ncbi:hypothetical protein [Bradyrhizobium sp.]
MQDLDPKCPRCMDRHPIIRCPYVKALGFEFAGDFNSINLIEFLTPADYGPQRAAPKEEPADDYPKLGPKAAA